MSTRINRELVEVVRNNVLSFLSRRSGWEGTMTELTDAIASRRNLETWPGSPSVLRRVINQVVPSIRRAGYRVEFSRTPDHERRRLVSFVRSGR